MSMRPPASKEWETCLVRPCVERPGYYIIVLDKYKQVYIGKTIDIHRRIRQHWTTQKPFDRTLFPIHAVTSSVFSIDFFRALDTTRVYAWRTSWLYLPEQTEEGQLIHNFPAKYLVNRLGGDVSNALMAILTMKMRDLSKFNDCNEIE